MGDRYPENLFELLELLERKGVDKSLYWKHITRFLERKSRRLHKPVHCIFELTPLCNFDCKMCYVHLSSSHLSGKKLLSLSQWKQLAVSAREAGVLTLALTGGECLTYPDFDGLYVFLVSLGFRVYIMSNGYLIDEKLELFREHRPAGIQISIYGSSDDLYEKVTGVRAFNRVYKNILRIRDADIPLRLSITPSAYMRDDVIPLIQLAENIDVKYGVNPQLLQPREETERAKEDLSLEEYLDIYRYLNSIHNQDLKTIDINEVPMENHDGPQRYGIRCGAGRSSFGIKYDGSMCPCLSLDKITVQPLEIGFEAAWKKISDAADQYPLPFECGDCVYQKHCLSCVAVHDSAPVPGHCDPSVCERMKRLVQEGFIPLKQLC